MSDQHKSLAEALAAFQAELPRVGKSQTANTGTYSFRYADLADVSAIVLPLLGKHGLSFAAAPTLDESGRFVLRYALRHVSGGESVSGDYPLPSSGTPQAIGSAITYARRYALCAVTGVAADEDDDGQAAANTRVDPSERHEHAYDPDEQQMLRDGYLAEIEAAKTEQEIAAVGARVREKRAKGELSPGVYQSVARAAARRLAEIAPPTTSPNLDSLPPGRRREMQALDRAVAAAKRERSDGSA